MALAAFSDMPDSGSGIANGGHPTLRDPSLFVRWVEHLPFSSGIWIEYTCPNGHFYCLTSTVQAAKGNYNSKIRFINFLVCQVFSELETVLSGQDIFNWRTLLRKYC